ncbi:MAG: ATP-binding protein [Sedimentisphaerales bacterium]|nr:ATP-binding protein [Sedimentisphaerales bacterium]
MYKQRAISNMIKRLTDQFPVVVLTGARQVGKSTLLRHLFPGYNFITFDPVLDVHNARHEPDLFLDNHPAPAVFDEIQYVPELVSAIKRRVDRVGKPNQYILTGSQQWSVMKNVSESLAGRAVILELDSFSLTEINELTPERNWLERWLEDDTQNFASSVHIIESDRTLYQQLWRGWMPKTEQLEPADIPRYYRSYLQTYIERDARMQADVKDWQQFGHFVQMASALTGQEVNYSQFGKKLGISYQTAQRWLGMLKATYQWFELPAYTSNTLKRVCQRSKGYIADTGLVCNLNMIPSPQSLAGYPQIGAIFETAVVNEIRKLNNLLSTPAAMYHWRSGNSEVDLVLERDNKLYPIEIKLTSNPGRKDTSGISSLRKSLNDKPIMPGLAICPCAQMLKVSDNDFCLPWNAY